MEIPREIVNNLRFLVAETGSQVSNLQDSIAQSSIDQARRVLERSGYAYNLMLRIHESCQEYADRSGRRAPAIPALRAIESVATEIERISGLCRECVKLMEQLDMRCWQGRKDYLSMLKAVGGALQRVEPALRSSKTAQAMKISRYKPDMDKTYNRLQKKYRSGIRAGRHTEDLVTGLLIAHAVNQMGDALLDISEAIISVNVGQPMNMDRYQSLRKSIDRLHSLNGASGLVVKPVAATRSGSGISGIARPDGQAGHYMAIYKDGRKRKLREERRGLQNWQEKFPGLTPRIISYRKRRQSASLLIEHLSGLTFEQVLLHESPAVLKKALRQLHRTMARVWDETRSGKPVAAGFMRQLTRRLEDVYMIHPEFRQQDCSIGGRKVPSFGTLLKKAHARESRINPPFSVYIHGDFNVDNIIYDPADGKIGFIDLHRSRYMDYVQDVSVFMVSNYRLQIFDAPLRRRILELTHEFYRFAAGYADKSGDDTFEMRLALGLARSFATSTRFILDKSLAHAMFMRSRYLIEQVLATKPPDAESYRVPVREIFVG